MKPQTFDLENGKLWKDWGIVLEKDMGQNWFIFDSVKGLDLINNIGYLSVIGDKCAIAGAKGTIAFEPSQLLDVLDKFIFQYFFEVEK